MIAYEDRDERGRMVLERRFDDWALRVDPIRQTLVEQHNNCGIYRRAPFLAAGGFDVDACVLFNEDDAMHCQLARAGLRFRAEPTDLGDRGPEGGFHVARSPARVRAGHVPRAREVRPAPPRELSRGDRAPALADGRGLGTYRDWEYADRCVRLARTLGVGESTRESGPVPLALPTRAVRGDTSPRGLHQVAAASPSASGDDGARRSWRARAGEVMRHRENDSA